MDIEKVMQFECKVCGRKINVSRSGDVYEEPVYCCGIEAAAIDVEEEEPIFVPPSATTKKLVRKKAKKKAKKVAKKKAKKVAKKKVKKKAKTKAKRAAKKEAKIGS